MNIILLGHQKNVGKDTIADILVEHAERVLGPGRGIKMGFADAIKDIAFRMFKTYGLKPGYFYDNPKNYHLKDIKLPDLGLSPRDIWINLGTFGRSQDKQVWSRMTADFARQAIQVPKVVVIKDFRFEEEPEPFEQMGLPHRKVKIHSHRAGEPDEPDKALLGYKKWHAHFYNDGPQSELPHRVLQQIWPLLECD